jgi:chemotaxis regulatin CheY-phosphate phosphatase CheZ
MSTAVHGRRRGALEDSESVLRQVNGALEDIGVGDAPSPDKGLTAAVARDAGRLPQLAATLIDAYAEINGLITMLKDSRDVLEKAALHRLHRTNKHLQDVSSATETAATDMLDGVDRTMGLLDELMTERDGGGDGLATAEQIRDVLHGFVISCQFQDITSQQLGYASSVLVDLEDRLARISAVFGDECFSEEEIGEMETELEDVLESHTTCDPDASLGDAEARQGLADSIFG